MELNYLNEEDVKKIMENKVVMLPATYNVLPFETFVKYQDSTIDFEGDQSKLDCHMDDYMECIDRLNSSLSETVIPFFRKLEIPENVLLLDYNANDFDSDMNYVGNNSPETLKSIIRLVNQRIGLSNTPYSIATSYDFTSILEPIKR